MNLTDYGFNGRFAALAQDCKFQNCTHTVEPGCRVLAALRDGGIPQARRRPGGS